MRRYAALLAAILMILVFLTACSIEINVSDKNISLGDAVMDEVKSFSISGDIISLDIEINAADFSIVHGEGFSLESNLKHLSVSEKNGVLVLRDKGKGGSDYMGAILTITVPEDTVFHKVNITTGAANLNVDHLSADSVELSLGAGKVEFGRLDANSDIEINGGAGEILIRDGSLRDLELSLGVGKLDLTCALISDSELKFGIGDSELTLIGNEDDYSFDVEKGLGSIRFNGDELSSNGIRGKGENRVEIEGGIGAVKISFKDE